MHKDKNGINIPVINRHRIKMELVLLAEYLYGPFPINEHSFAIAGSKHLDIICVICRRTHYTG